MLNCINLSGKRLTRLVHNLLLYSELKTISNDDTKVSSLRKEITLDSKEAIAKIVTKNTSKYARQADINLELENACVQIGFNSFATLVTELVDNACKFSASGTPIKVSSKIEDCSFVLAVSDFGKGMSTEQISQIGMGIQFDRLVDEQQGLGLGLAISQNIAQLHGGNLFINSKLNSSTEVKVTLPIAGKHQATYNSFGAYFPI